MDPAKQRQREIAERRKMRIREVRNQEKQFASQIRDDYQQRLAKERDIITAHLRSQHLSEQEEKHQAAELAYQQSLKDLGRSHNLAVHTNIEQANDSRVRKLLDARKRAEERHAIALQNLQEQKKQSKQNEQWRLQRKKMVHLAEKERASRLAAKPLPPSQDIILNFAVSKGRRVRLTNVEGYSATYYHLAPEMAHRETPEKQKDAYRAADQVEDLMRRKEEATAREQEERDEKAWLRHQHACKEIRLKQGYSDMMGELALLERADRLHRQKTLQQLPKRVFIPPHRWMEEAAELQREMERAFEEIAVQDEECHSELNRSLDGPPEAPALFISQPPPVTPPVDTSCESKADETDSSKVTATDDQVSAENEPPKVYQDKSNGDTHNSHLQQRFDPIQQLLERVRAQRQAWADYYHSRESAPVIPQTSSSETTTDEEGKRTGTEDHMDDSGKDHFIDVLGADQQMSVAREIVETETTASSMTTAENDGQQHQPVKLPITTDLAQNGVVQTVTVDSSPTTDRPDVTDSHRDTSQSVLSSSTVSGAASSSGHALTSDHDQPKTVTYRTPDALLQHILEQRKQYEEQRSMISSQYSRVTDRSSTVGKAPAMDTVMPLSVSQQPPILPQSISPAIPTASIQYTSLFSRRPAPTVPLTPLHTRLDNSSGVDVDRSSGEFADGQSVKSPSRSGSCHSVLDDVKSPSAVTQSQSSDGLTDFSKQGNEEGLNVKIAADTDRILGHPGYVDGNLLPVSVSDHHLEQAAKNSDHLETNDSWSTASSSQPSDRSIIAPATEDFTDHQHSPKMEEFVPSAAAYVVPLPTSCGLQHLSMEADEILEQVEMPLPIVLPSTGSHSPLSYGSGSLIDLSQCVDFSQMLREPGDGSHLVDLKESCTNREPDKPVLQHHPAKLTVTNICSNSTADEQHPWSFYLRTGRDPPQLSTSSSSCHSLPDIQGSKDANSGGLSFPFQPLEFEDKFSNNACMYSLQLEPDPAYLQSARKGQGKEGGQSHTDSSDSQLKGPKITADRQELNKGLSLQEAFLRRKQKFVSASETRQQQIPMKAKDRERRVAEMRPTQRVTSTPIRNQGPAVSKKSQPAWQPGLHAGKATVPPQGEKARQREQNERNKRLYEKLPEVRRKREEQTRQAFYAQNRTKAKQFGQNLQNHMKRESGYRSTSTS